MLVHGPYPLGEGRVAREALAALDAGWEVDVVATRLPGELAMEQVDGVRVRRLPIAHERGVGALAVAREYVGFTALAAATVARAAARSSYDVVHVHNPPDFLIIAALLPALRGSRVILDIHDLAPELFAVRFDGRRGLGLAVDALRLIERFAARAASAVVTVHEPYRRALEERGVPQDKITVVLNSLDERLLPSAPSAPTENGFRVVYHGTITPHYGVDQIVEAVALVADEIEEVSLELFGDGDALGDVEARAAELGIADRVRLSRAYLPQREVLARIAGAAAGVVSARGLERNHAAVPTKLFEYARLGIPVVTADLRAIHDYFTPAEVRYYRADSSEALAEALRELAAAPAEARAMAAAARSRYEEYRWAASARRYIELLERLT